jgi:hypothetical protein
MAVSIGARSIRVVTQLSHALPRVYVLFSTWRAETVAIAVLLLWVRIAA